MPDKEHEKTEERARRGGREGGRGRSFRSGAQEYESGAQNVEQQAAINVHCPREGFRPQDFEFDGKMMRNEFQT